jgi:hypothetical protein
MEAAPPEEDDPAREREISSSEWMMENNRYQRHAKPMDFADLEN